MKLAPRDSLDVDRSIPVTETEVEFCDICARVLRAIAYEIKRY